MAMIHRIEDAHVLARLPFGCGRAIKIGELSLTFFANALTVAASPRFADEPPGRCYNKKGSCERSGETNNQELFNY